MPDFTQSQAVESPTRPRAIPRTDLATIILHWLMVATLAISASTGLRVAADDGSPFWATWLAPLLLQGQVSQWHVLAALVFVSLSAAYLWFLGHSKQGTRHAVYRQALRSRDHQSRWSARNRLLYWLAAVLLATLLSTGVLMYFLPELLPNRLVSSVHQGATWGLLLYVVAHVGFQMVLGGWRQLIKIFNPRLAYLSAALVGAAAMAGLALSAGALDILAIADLHATNISAPLDAKSMPSPAQWESAQPVNVRTTHGANFPGGEVVVTVRALHDEKHAYFRYEWADSTHSRKHLPILKTEQGWRLMHNDYFSNNETAYYEDKFAVLLANTKAIAGGTSQLGPDPLPGTPPPANGRGLHFTTDGSLSDMWHWKANRTGVLAQMDDNFFGPPLAPQAGKRYTAGYSQDEKLSGGYENNLKRIGKTDLVNVQRLPKDWSALQGVMGPVNLDPNVSEQGVFHMWIDDTIPYSKTLDDAIEVGTVLPSVLHSKPFEGDRGDVVAHSQWTNGRWKLTVRRALQTDSASDLQIQSGVYMWVAAFDHAQTQHTRHMRPMRIVLD